MFALAMDVFIGVMRLGLAPLARSKTLYRKRKGKITVMDSMTPSDVEPRFQSVMLVAGETHRTHDERSHHNYSHAHVSSDSNGFKLNVDHIRN